MTALLVLIGVVVLAALAVPGMRRLTRRPDDRAEFLEVGQRDPRPAAIAALKAAEQPVYDQARAIAAKRNAEHRDRLKAKLAARPVTDDRRVLTFRKAGRS
jgi:hypothetical protein